MIEKNQHKARNLLKRVGKMEMSDHDGEDFEKANLLLAKFYIDKGKNDLAQELCKKTLVQNKSCSQAWEILGLVFEKEANYEMASDCYQKAWKLEFEASASVGFKLAFSHLKCKQFVMAVDVCEAVLAQYPDYPRIADEILKKAQNSFRTSA
jgi:tetratricopeptide repeat protein 21B